MSVYKTISVIVPMYNAADTIINTLTSVKDQTYPVHEIIVVDDGSIDNSLQLVSQFAIMHPKCPIKILKKINGGVSSARNMGLSDSTGDFIALIDSDDEWLLTKLERQMNTIQDRPDIDFLGCSRNNEVLQILGRVIENLHKATVRELFIKMYPQTSTAIFKRSLYEQFGGYNETMTHGEDGNLWIRYCANSNFYYMPDSLVITGNGKPSFGHSGLSSNLEAMQNGNDFTLSEARKNGMISFGFFLTIYLYSRMKYLRRILITKSR